MWTCKRCGKPVYFAERRQSIGFDWHRQCLRCDECGKVLHPGQHAEHKERPYCSIPCYSALFGPKLFGHGSTVESHQSFGKRSGEKLLESLDFERRVREYNDNVDKDAGSSKLELTSRFVNGRFVLEGVLRIYWGVQRSIRVKEFEDKRPIAKGRPASVAIVENSQPDVVLRRKIKSLEVHQPQRHSMMTFGLTSGLKAWDEAPLSTDQDLNRSSIWSTEAVSSQEVVQRTLLHRTLSDSNLLSQPSFQESPFWTRSSYQTLPINFGRTKGAVIPLRLDRYEGLSDLSQEGATLKFDYSSLQPEELMTPDKDFDPVLDFALENPEKNHEEFRKPETHRGLRRRHGRKFESRKNAIRRRSSFNGHWYDRETSVFTPPKDSCMSVWISSLVQTREVLQMLLDKYKVENEPDRFAIFVVKETGERRMLTDSEYPLVLRVNLGPHENIARMYIFDKNLTSEVNHEVAQYLRFSYSECRAILNMFYEEEEREVEFLRRKYKVIKKVISKLIREKWTPDYF